MIGTGQAGYDRVRTEQFRRDVRERLAAVPGVERVSWASNLPLFARASHPSDAAILYVRTEADPEAALLTAQRQMKAIDPRIEANDARTIRTVIGQSLFGVTIGVGLLGVFGLIALGLASLGLYGAMAHPVRQRQREIGIRMAPGAGHGTVLGLVLRQGLVVVVVGIGVGLAASLFIGRALAGILFGVTPADPLALGAAALVLLLTATAACYLPARRASRLDPLQALRQP